MQAETVSIEEFNALKAQIAEMNVSTRRPGEFRVKAPLETRIEREQRKLKAEEYITSVESEDEDPYFVAGRVLLATNRVAAERIVHRTHRLSTSDEIRQCLADDASRRAEIMKLAAAKHPKTVLSPETVEQFGQVVAVALNEKSKQEAKEKGK
jgi:hypothetical protein